MRLDRLCREKDGEYMGYRVEWIRALSSDEYIKEPFHNPDVKEARDLRQAKSFLKRLKEANEVVNGVLTCQILHNEKVVECWRSHPYPDF